MKKVEVTEIYLTFDALYSDLSHGIFFLLKGAIVVIFI